MTLPLVHGAMIVDAGLSPLVSDLSPLCDTGWGAEAHVSTPLSLARCALSGPVPAELKPSPVTAAQESLYERCWKYGRLLWTNMHTMAANAHTASTILTTASSGEPRL